MPRRTWKTRLWSRRDTWCPPALFLWSGEDQAPSDAGRDFHALVLVLALMTALRHAWSPSDAGQLLHELQATLAPLGAGLHPGQAQDLLYTPLVEGQGPFQLAAALCCVFRVPTASGAMACGHSGGGSCRGRDGGPVEAVFAPLAALARPLAGASKPRSQRPRPTTAWLHRWCPARARHRPPGPAVAMVVGPFSSHSAPWAGDDDVEVLSDAPTTSPAMCPALPGSISWMADCCCDCCPLGMMANEEEEKEEEEAPHTNSWRAVLKVALPGAALFTYAGVASAAWPKSPHRSRWRARPRRAAVPQCWPTVHQQGILTVLTHYPPSEGSQGVRMPGQALLLMRLQDHVPIEDVGSALRKGVDQVLVGAGYQLFDDLRLRLGQDAYGIRLLVQVEDLGHVPGVLEQDDVSSIQADGQVAGVFVKNILDQMNDGRVIMMGPAREPRTHQAGVGCLHVVDNDQSSQLRGQLLSEVLSPIQQLYRARSLPGQFPVSWLHMTVKDQDTSGCLGHDPRGQCH